MQAKKKLTALYKAVAKDTYRVEGKRLYAPDGTWMEKTSLVPRIPIHGIGASVRFPDVLKLPQEKLELFQLGWRASDEFTNSRKSNSDYATMKTAQPWQVFAWVAVRFGELYANATSVNLTREGVSVVIRIIATSW
jgi:virulence-associated protein VagC